VDAGSGAEPAVLRGQERVVHRVAFSPGGARIGSQDFDMTVPVWDAATFEYLEIPLKATARIASSANRQANSFGTRPFGRVKSSSNMSRRERSSDAIRQCIATLRRPPADADGVGELGSDLVLLILESA
jgi:hypothetical protein